MSNFCLIFLNRKIPHLQRRSMENKSFFSSSTFVPISFVVIIIGVAFFIFNVKALAESTTKEVDKLNERVEKVDESNKTLLDRTARLEEKIDFIVGKFDPKSKLLIKK